jgi:hypothetical protein
VHPRSAWGKATLLMNNCHKFVDVQRLRQITLTAAVVDDEVTDPAGV